MWANGARTKNDSAQRGLKRASTSATKVTSSSPTPACVTKRARRGPTVRRRRQGSRVLRPTVALAGGRRPRCSCDTSRVVLGLGKRRREESGQDSRASVIVGQSIDHLIERDQSGGREEPSLTHRSSESLSFNPGAFHQSSRTGEERADRRTETFGQTRHDVVAGAAYCAALVPVATTALNNRAPSKCTGRPSTARASASMSATSNGVPPDGMCVFSSDTMATCG